MWAGEPLGKRAGGRRALPCLGASRAAWSECSGKKVGEAAEQRGTGLGPQVGLRLLLGVRGELRRL